ncbi:hypothetical protein GCM10027444_36550 [Actinopolyspora lacussalsi]
MLEFKMAVPVVPVVAVLVVPTAARLGRGRVPAPERRSVQWRVAKNLTDGKGPALVEAGSLAQ